MALVRSSARHEFESSSSSNTTTPSGCRYHVFLSFRGKDTRKGFTDHLYTEFVDQGFRTFRDDDELERGEDINPGLQSAILTSQCSVIVFSKDYASSRWCLDEVLMILQHKRTSDHVVLPVFYDVDPSEVRKQTGGFGEAFAGHQKTQPSNKVKQWRAALKEVADLGGMVLPNQDDGYESKFIKKIVRVIGDKLSRPLLRVPPNVIGIHSQVHSINSWLQDGSTDVGILAIYGMSGIGKTTIAKAVYNSNERKFEGSSFLENIRERSERPDGLVQIQIQLLSNIFNGRKVKINSVSHGMMKIREVISSKRILLVLDDVDDLDAVLNMHDHFFPGSKIILTTKREKLSKDPLVTKVHLVKNLRKTESLELFSWHAFGQDHPVESYEEHSANVVKHCGGLPLALQVLGSSLSGEGIAVWESALKKLEAIPNEEIMKKLRISFDCLQDDHDKQLFLHIACFFIGKDKDFIVTLLDGCDFYTIVGIQNLTDRCLVTVDTDNRVQMHDMIRDMGRGIVRLESEEPESRSRLWYHKDSLRVLREKIGTETIQGIVLNMHMNYGDGSSVILETNSFARMRKLRFLHFSLVQLKDDYKDFPTGLKWLCWFKFSLDSIPDDFSLEGLLILEMHHSSLTQVWNGTKCLPLLKIIDLSHSHSLTETTDLSIFPNLERLILEDCVSLIDVDISIRNQTLVYLNLKDCRSIGMLPNSICNLKLLESLIISGCSNLKELPIDMVRYMTNLKVFEAGGIPINVLVGTSGENMSWPGGSSSAFWTSLPCSLVKLNLEGCNLSDGDFNRGVHNQPSLEILELGNNPINSLPNFIRGLKRLRILSFYDCHYLKSLVELPTSAGTTMTLDVASCTSLAKITYQSFPGKKVMMVKDSNPSLVEVEYQFKLEPIGEVDVEMLNLLGLRNVESMPTIQILTEFYPSAQERHIQGLSEFGIFSTFLPGNEVPGQFSHRYKRPSNPSLKSFTLPSLPNLRIRGWNIFVVYAFNLNYKESPDLPAHWPLIIKFTHKSKSINWIYGPSCHGDPSKGEDMIWLSHWNVHNEIQGGDEVAFSLYSHPIFVLKEWGIQIVPEQEENMSTQSNRLQGLFGYPQVIGGDLSAHEVIPRVYWLLADCHSREEIDDDDGWYRKVVEDCEDNSGIFYHVDPEEEEATSFSTDKFGLRSWEISTKSSMKESYNDIVEQDGNPSTSTQRTERSSGMRTRTSSINVFGESSGTRNELLLEQEVTDSAPLHGNDEVAHPVAKEEVADEELMQCFGIMNAMDHEIDDDNYAKALMIFRRDATWRKIFLRMPGHRRKSFIFHLHTTRENPFRDKISLSLKPENLSPKKI